VVRRSISIVAGLAASLMFAAAAHAAGLGRLTVLSTLGEPLAAEIEIVSLAPGEDEGLAARLGGADLFAQAGIDVNPALNTVRITIERRDKRPYLRVTTRDPINEPFLDVLIELQWSSGRLVREYTFLLDPPEYRSRRQAIAAAPTPPAPAPAAENPAPTPAPAAEEPKPAAEAAPAPAAPASEAAPSPVLAMPGQSAPAAVEQKPLEEKPAAEKPAAEKPAAEKPAGNSYEVKRGDTLGAIAKANLPAGVSLNQMLIAIFRANEDAFIRGNVNLVRTGKILNLPEPDAIGTIDREEANRLVKEQHDQWMEYRSRLAAVQAPAEAAAPQQEAAGRIEPKPEAPKPAPSDEVRLSKAEPGKPAAPASRAAREDDAAARERALQEAQSRTNELEKNVADLQKLLALKNQQLAELEKKAGAKPAPVPPVAQAPAQQPTAPAKPEAPKPAAEAPAPAAEAPKPAAEAPKPAAEAPKPPAEPPRAVAPAPRPVVKKAPPPPEPSIIDEFLDNPTYIALLGALVVLLVVYFVYSWRRKKNAQARFQDSVLGAAAAGGASLGEASSPSTTTSTKTASQAPAGMEAEEVDPIAEADVYMAYGRDAQAEEILKEALQKDARRTAVHGKLLEIYAHRKDTRAFEQTAQKLRSLTSGSGPEWEKAAALGRSIDPGNSLYGGAMERSPSAAAPPISAPAAPTLDFDLGGTSQVASPVPDISFDEPPRGPGTTTTGMDLDLGATRPTLQTQKLPAMSPDQTIATGGEKSGSGGLDFNLDLGSEEKPSAAAAKPAEPSGGLDFDLNLDLDKGESPKPEPAKIDLADISLDLGNPADDATVLAKGGADPKWQEVATKLDLAKAYEEMGDKDGARELLKEVMKDGDAAQRGTAEQLLAKLG
jgi:pilus assembly protein FimV